MRKSIAVFLFAALAAFASDALAVPTINVGNWSFPQNSGVHQIPVYATGTASDFLTVLNFVAMTGDGGPSTTENVNDPLGQNTGQGVVPAPNITANIFASNSAWGATLLNPSNASPPQDLAGLPSDNEGTQTVMTYVLTRGTEVSMNGRVLLGIVSVDTNNTGISTGPYPGLISDIPATNPDSTPNYAAVGTYHFDMGGSPKSDPFINNDGMPIATGYANGGPETFFNTTDGTITITAAPEPSTMVLAIAGIVGLAAWRLRRRNRSV